jgi:hypothetical protein
MPKGMQAIYTQTASSGGASSIVFNNIPQTYTDIVIEGSTRISLSSVLEYNAFRFNNDSSNNYSYTFLNGTGTSTYPSRNQNASFWFASTNGSNNTANVFGSFKLTIPNYSGSNFKSGLIECINENNSTAAYMDMHASLYRSNAPITKIEISSLSGGTLVQHSTFTLYGISR